MLVNLIAQLKKTKIVKTYRPADVDEIEASARLLAVDFPAKYIEFLATCGLMGVYERSVFGLGPDTRRDKSNSVIFHTLEARSYANVRLPPHLLAIWHDSHLDYQCLDTSQIHRGDCPVVYYDTVIAKSRKPIPRLMASGFHEWLQLKVAEQLKVKADWDEYEASKKTKNKRRKVDARR